MEKNLVSLLNDTFSQGNLISAVLSSPREKGKIEKTIIRPLEIKGKLLYQVSDHYSQRVLHENLPPQKLKDIILERMEHFKQGVLFTTSADYHLLVNKSQKVTILKKAPSKKPEKVVHNRPKKYLLEEDVPLPFLVHSGLMSRDGKVVAKMRDKFKQINRFLELVDDVLPHLDRARRIHVVDFGCGKSYLTFALYHYLTMIQGMKISVVGLDLKSDVIQKCQELAAAFGYKDLKFTVGDIQSHIPQGKIDLVVSLHACNTATDAALEKAVRWDADVILAVPCCQHELFKQIKSEALSPILEFGILKERFAAIATDAARAKILQILGYHTQVLEFIDMEHTPKNVLIRAVKEKGPLHNKQVYIEEYRRMKQLLNISPTLEKAIQL